MSCPIIDGRRMLVRLEALGRIGAVQPAGCTRLALSNEDRMARDLVRSWLEQAGAEVHVDMIGNIIGIVPGINPGPPVMTGSHIDTVSNAGKLDGCYGVIAGIDMLQSIRDAGLKPLHSLAVVIFSNEEGARFSPDLLGSRVIAKDISLQEALAVQSRDGKSFGSELKHIGYGGATSPWMYLPHKFIELHIEQGPVLEATGNKVGIVEGVQGHSWWQVVVEGVANHAGTTPMKLRQDAGAVAMKLACALQASAVEKSLPAVATVGTFTLEPNSINVVPGRARFTIDFRDVDDAQLRKADAFLKSEVKKIQERGFSVQLTSISRATSVRFDSELCDALQASASKHGAVGLRMVSGASHDAQMMAVLCPTAMLFVPSISGISHNPKEQTLDEDLVMGAQILTDTLWSLATTA